MRHTKPEGTKKSLAKTAFAALAATSLSTVATAGVTLDGVLTSADEYSHVYEVDMVGGGSSHLGTLRLNQSGNDIHMMLEVSTDIHDLTFGANRAPGWNSAVDYNDIQGSEKFKFKMNINNSEETIEIKMRDDGTTGAPPGFDIAQDGGGALLGASSSLNRNLELFGNQFINDSPECGSTLGAPTSDQDCYLNPVAGAEQYEFAQIYELHFDGSLFNFSDVGDLLSTIVAGTTELHASPAKSGSKTSYSMGCMETNSCNRVVDASTPASLGMMLTGMAAMFFRRRAVKQA